MKAVTFQIKGCYLDQIFAGTKIEEYRSISEHNTKLLCEQIDKKDLSPGDHYVKHFKEIWRLKKDLTHIQFLNGYRPERKKLLCELIKIEIVEYIKKVPEGLKPGTVCFTLTLGQIIESKNFK